MFGIENLEIEFLYAIQNLLKNPFMDGAMKGISYVGNSGALWIVVALVFLLTKKHRKTGVLMCVGLLLGLLVGNLLLKNLIARPRPCWVASEYALLIPSPTDYSFPSGHTLASFISAFIILDNSKKLGIPALIIATLMAFSRMYLFVHFPTDILGGIILALLIVAFLKLCRKLCPRKKH